MSFKTARQAVESYFAANWTATSIAYENVAFTPPVGGKWVKILIAHSEKKLSIRISSSARQSFFRKTRC